MKNRTSWAPLALLVPLLLGACASGSGGDGPHREAFNSSTLFSGSVRAGNLVFTSGVIGRSDDGVGAATRQALSGVQTRLEAAGATMADAVKCTVFLLDIGDYNEMNQVYQEFFPESPPARTALAVRDLPANAQVEVECVAAVR